MEQRLDWLESRIKRELGAVGDRWVELHKDGKQWIDRTEDIVNGIWKAVEPRYQFTAMVKKGGLFKPKEGRIAWLWDAIAFEDGNWENRPGDTGGLLTLQLVAESELGGRKEAQKDFQRLMVARAEHRLLVFDHHTREEAEGTIDHCMRAVRNYRGTLKGDRYLFACWIRQPREHFEFWLRIAQ
jgi:hypothetical protein